MWKFLFSICKKYFIINQILNIKLNISLIRYYPLLLISGRQQEKKKKEILVQVIFFLIINQLLFYIINKSHWAGKSTVHVSLQSWSVLSLIKYYSTLLINNIGKKINP